jgi:transposase
MPSKYDASTRAKAIRLVYGHAGDYPTEWAAITAVSGRLGMSAETLRKWIRQAEVDAGEKPGMTTQEAAEIRELWRKNRELEQKVSTKPNAPGTARRSGTGRWIPWPTSRRSPPPGCTGTTPAGSCTASAGGRPPKPRPSTTLPARPSATRSMIFTRNEACMKPGSPHRADGSELSFGSWRSGGL